MARFDSMQRAVDKAEHSVDKRLEGMNEFRASMADTAKLQMSRAEIESRLGDLDKQIASMISRMDRNEGRGTGLDKGWGYLLGGIGLIGSLIAIFFSLMQ